VAAAVPRRMMTSTVTASVGTEASAGGRVTTLLRGAEGDVDGAPGVACTCALEAQPASTRPAVKTKTRSPRIPLGCPEPGESLHSATGSAAICCSARGEGIAVSTVQPMYWWM
jgi:hypothetical protein